MIINSSFRYITIQLQKLVIKIILKLLYISFKHSKNTYSGPITYSTKNLLATLIFLLKTPKMEYHNETPVQFQIRSRTVQFVFLWLLQVRLSLLCPSRSVFLLVVWSRRWQIVCLGLVEVIRLLIDCTRNLSCIKVFSIIVVF